MLHTSNATNRRKLAHSQFKQIELSFTRKHSGGALKAYETGASRADQNGIKTLQVRALTSLMRPYGLIDPDRGIAAIDEATHVGREVGAPALLARPEMLAATSHLLDDAWRTEDADVVASAHRTIASPEGMLSSTGEITIRPSNIPTGDRPADHS